MSRDLIELRNDRFQEVYTDACVHRVLADPSVVTAGKSKTLVCTQVLTPRVPVFGYFAGRRVSFLEFATLTVPADGIASNL